MKLLKPQLLVGNDINQASRVDLSKFRAVFRASNGNVADIPELVRNDIAGWPDYYNREVIGESYVELQLLPKNLECSTSINIYLTYTNGIMNCIREYWPNVGDVLPEILNQKRKRVIPSKYEY